MASIFLLWLCERTLAGLERLVGLALRLGEGHAACAGRWLPQHDRGAYRNPGAIANLGQLARQLLGRMVALRAVFLHGTLDDRGHPWAGLWAVGGQVRRRARREQQLVVLA